MSCMAVPRVLAMRHPGPRFVFSQCQPETKNKNIFRRYWNINCVFQTFDRTSF